MNQIKANAYERSLAEGKVLQANPIGVAEYQLQAALPAKPRGKLPTAKQLEATRSSDARRVARYALNVGDRSTV